MGYSLPIGLIRISWKLIPLSVPIALWYSPKRTLPIGLIRISWKPALGSVISPLEMTSLPIGLIRISWKRTNFRIRLL